MSSATVFFFLAVASIGFFGFLIATRWIEARADDRRARERFALLRKLADQPTESVQRLIDLVREDDAREALREQRRLDAARREELKGGVILVAVGACLAVFLANLTPMKALWTIGLIPASVGVVTFVFAFFSPRPRPRSEARS